MPKNLSFCLTIAEWPFKSFTRTHHLSARVLTKICLLRLSSLTNSCMTSSTTSASPWHVLLSAGWLSHLCWQVWKCQRLDRGQSWHQPRQRTQARWMDQEKAHSGFGFSVRSFWTHLTIPCRIKSHHSGSLEVENLIGTKSFQKWSVYLGKVRLINSPKSQTSKLLAESALKPKEHCIRFTPFAMLQKKGFALQSTFESNQELKSRPTCLQPNLESRPSRRNQSWDRTCHMRHHH